MKHFARFILDGHKVVPTEDGDAVERATGTTVAQTYLGDTAEESVRVSTVFLAIVMPPFLDPPRPFETMVFGGPLDGTRYRYQTWEDAEQGHAEMVDRVARAQAGRKS